jgi:CheY-like chemotaxis protein/anti-sigma regulatory factor (Ser/Thr protein kinase)
MIHTLLLVDDEPFNLELMSEQLADAGYKTVAAESGEAAWTLLQDESQQFSAVLLDKMMPGMNGFELLRRIKQTPRLEFLPVVMQTAVGTASSIQEGLSAGVFYYLTKPFTREILLAVVTAAVSHWDRHAHFKALTEQQIDALLHLNTAQFRLKTYQQAQNVTSLLAHTCPQPGRVATGLFELFVNAIEHGNLGLSYDEKSRLQYEGRWEAELERRLDDPEWGHRQVDVRFDRFADRIEFQIQDQGAGFDWQPYLESSPTLINETHGRGIMIAQRLAFDAMEYLGNGNCVRATVYLNDTP